MASTTTESQSADSTKDVDVPSSTEQSPTEEKEISPTESQPPQIKNNQQIRVERNASHQSEDEEEEPDDDSNDGGGVPGDEAISTTSGPSNNGFHDESSGGSTSSGSRIPAYSGSGSSSFNAPICSPTTPFQTGSSKSNPFSVSTSPAVSFQQRPLLRPSAFKFPSTNSPQTNLSTGVSTAAAPSSSPFVLRPPKLIPTASSGGSLAANSKQPASEDFVQETPTFVPLEKESSVSEAQSHAPPEETVEKKPESVGAEAASSSSFVFGSNLSERVLDGMPSSTSSGVKRKLDAEDGTQEIKKSSIGEEEVKPLLPLKVLTGEESEINVLQIQCRLFIFDATKSSWIERGHGLLRLNDSKDSKQPSSRLIIRTKGSLRVMLNTKVWDGMRAEKCGDKCVRLMAVDLDDDSSTGDAGSGSALKIFLIRTTSTSDTLTLSSAIESRVRKITSEGESERKKIT